MLKFNQLRTVFLLLFMALGVTLSAQAQHTVRGKVLDQSNQPMVGVSVVEVARSNGVLTNLDGDFILEVAQPDATLAFTYIGYQTVEMAANSPLLQSPIILQPLQELLDEVVVIGYGTVKKDDLTGSVSVVTADDLARGAISSPQEMMMGKLPGLHVVAGDGGPGAGVQLRVRGQASLRASNDPLIVIDGVPVSNDGAPGMANPLNTINPNDIESFTVLKDASSTAIYGSRASNGVIIITTKKGGGKKLNLSYNSSYSISTNPKTVSVMSGDEYRNVVGKFKPDYVDNLGSGNTDWQDQIFRNAFATDQSLSAYGSFTENFPYRFSFGYSNEDGTLETSKFERTTLDISLTPKFFKEHLQVSFNAKGVYNKNRFADSGAVNAAAFYDPTRDPYFRNADGSIDHSRANGYFNWMTENSDGSWEPNQLAGVSPLSMLYDNNDRNEVYRMMGNIQLDYKLHWHPQLRFNLNLGLDMSQVKGKNGVTPYSFQALKDRHEMIQTPGQGSYEKYTNQRSNELLEFYTAYGDEYGRHKFDVMAGYSWQHYYTKNDPLRYTNYVAQMENANMGGYPGWNNDHAHLPYDGYETYRTENYQISFFGRLNYSYDNRYLFTVSYRRDGSSRFHKDNRWGNFPAAAFAWNLANEQFLRNSRALSNLKLRLSWGKTGQQDLGLDDYPYMARYTLSTSPETQYLIDGEYYNPLKPLAFDPNIKWEVTTTYNAGVDFGFLNGRINGSVDYYWRETSDMLNNITVPMGSNFSNRVVTNIGNMENQGVELAVNFIPVQTRDWSVELGFNATWQQTKITKLTLADADSDIIRVGGISGGTGNTVQAHKVGYSPYTFYTYKQVYDNNGKPIQNALVDMDNDGNITASDLVMSGKSPDPDWYYGVNATVRFRNWDLSISGHGSIGNWMYNDFWGSNSTLAASFYGQGFYNNYAKDVRRTGFTKNHNAQQYVSDLFLENASFFRLDNITLGYTFPKLGKTDMSLRTAFNVQNVFVITDYSGLDPEGWGIDNNIWPRPRIFSLRLSLNF